jgi:hypothetical protein
VAAQQWNKQEMNKHTLDIHCTQFTVFIAIQNSGPHMEEADLRMIAGKSLISREKNNTN